MLKCGIDTVEIERIEKSLKSPAFFANVYGERERAEWEKRGKKAQSAAAAFAAKEAFSKALGTGIRGFLLSEVEVLHDALGAPYFHFTGKAREIVKKSHLKFTLSITHTKDLATAMVLAFEEGVF